MLTLTLRTDNPQAEIGLYDDNNKLAYKKWAAHRQLAETLHTEIKSLLHGQEKSWQDIEAIVCFLGPGSFTGLRIGLSVANALAGSLGVPVLGKTGEHWISEGLQCLASGNDEKIVMPHYGADAHITYPKT